MAHSIAKYSLFYLTLVLITQQYLSVPPQPGWERERAKRAVLQDAPDGNQTSGGRLNSSLTSAERLEQLQKLRDAETMLRKNLKEKGKEYENQLYENWPKFVDQIEKAGPSFFYDKEGLALLHLLNHTMDDVQTKWGGIVDKLRDGVEMKKIMATYFEKVKTAGREEDNEAAPGFC